MKAEILDAAWGQVDARFWNKVDTEVDPWECCLWTAHRLSYGYGTHWLGGKKRTAHSVAYELAFGPIPDGLQVCHDCDNPPCCNPNHLFLCTQKQNMRDMTDKGRRNFDGLRVGHGLRGEAHNGAKLCELDVFEIRRLYASGNVAQEMLATMFQISQGQIYRIVNRKNWIHI